MITLLLSYAVQSVFLLVVLYFALYVLLELRVLLISTRTEKRRKQEKQRLVEWRPAGTDVGLPQVGFPKVSVLLPVCNEADVVERLIDAACRLEYPVDALEILARKFHQKESAHTFKPA